jgi:hypothetical protein
MATAHEIDVEHRVVRSHMWGVFTDQQLREHYQSIREDEAFDPRFSQLTSRSTSDSHVCSRSPPKPGAARSGFSRTWTQRASGLDFKHGR